MIVEPYLRWEDDEGNKYTWKLGTSYKKENSSRYTTFYELKLSNADLLSMKKELIDIIEHALKATKQE